MDNSIIKGDIVPPYFQKIEQAKKDDELIRENSTQIKQILQNGISIQNKKDVTELADQLSGNIELAHAIARKTMGRAKFSTLMK